MHLQVLALAFTLLAAPSSGGAAWYDVWRGLDVDPLIVESVVWPEMERYSRLQDLMETGKLQVKDILKDGKDCGGAAGANLLI